MEPEVGQRLLMGVKVCNVKSWDPKGQKAGKRWFQFLVVVSKRN